MSPGRVPYYTHMARALAIVLCGLQLAASAHGTLVAIVPARDGLAIAADSRLTFFGAECDGAFKIIEPARPARTVAVVTGDSIFVPPPPSGQNPCRYLSTAPRLLDVGQVVANYLDRLDRPSRIPVADLAAACVRAVERFRAAYPAALRSYARKEIFSVVVASYNPASAESTLDHFVVRIDAGSGRVQAARIAATTVNARSPRGVWIYGEAEYLNREVYAGAGRRFLAPATLDFLALRKPVEDVPMDRAVAVAANVVRAAARAAQLVPPPSGIGGPVRVVVLGNNLRPQSLSGPARH